jgi:hypothetical protein
MLTEHEKSKLDRHIDGKENQAPNWLIVEDLLDFADRLKTKCDDVSDRIFLRDSFQLLMMLAFILAVIFIAIIGWKHDVHLKDIFEGKISGLSYVVLTIFGLTSLISFVLIEMSLRKLRRRMINDLKAVDSIVDLLHENYSPITKDFSELQRIQFKIKLSRFDIKSPLREPIYLRIIRLIGVTIKPFVNAVFRISTLIDKK